MTNEQKLWQRRAGILTEGEYMNAMEEQPAATTAEDPNVQAISKTMDMRQSSLKAIDTVVELEKLFATVLDKIQSSNKNALSDNEILMTLRKALASRAANKKAQHDQAN